MSVFKNLKVAITMFQQKRLEKLALIYQSYPKEDHPVYGVGHSYVYVQTKKEGVRIL